ncbi:MAG: type II toxin-antitoxin system RatA family toxin [Gemmatimonadaceae bacterium]
MTERSLAPDAQYDLGPMPLGRPMETVDEQTVRAPLATVFPLARDVERWPDFLPHYRSVRFLERSRDGGGLVEMAAWRPFGSARWPTWWISEMEVDHGAPAIRYRHVRGITTEMDVEWTFEDLPHGVRVRIVHAWNGPRWPLIGVVAAVHVIGPVFIHGIASRTLAGLAAAAERNSNGSAVQEGNRAV